MKKLIIRLSIVAFIVLSCVLTSCSSPSGEHTAKPLTNIIKLYDYTVTTTSGVVINYYVYAADEYDAQRLVDKVQGADFKSGSMKKITTINKPFTVYR